MNLPAARIYFPEDDGREIIRTSGELLDSWQSVWQNMVSNLKRLVEAGTLKRRGAK